MRGEEFMRKIISICISIVLILSSFQAVVSGAEVTQYQNFDFTQYEKGASSFDKLSISRYSNTADIQEAPNGKNALAVIGKSEQVNMDFKTSQTVSEGKYVLEATFSAEDYDHSLCRLFTVMDVARNYSVSAVINNGGKLVLHDNTYIADLKPNRVYTFSIVIDLDDDTYRVYLNNKTVIKKHKMNTPLDNISVMRIQLASITPTAKIYFYNIRMYRADGKVAEEDMPVIPTPPPYPQPDAETVVNEDIINSALAGYTALSAVSPRARVNNELCYLGGDNKNIMSFEMGGDVFVPVEFAKKVLNDASLSVANINGSAQELKNAPVEKDGITYIPICETARLYGKEVMNDKCGYIVIGENANEFDLAKTRDKKILDGAFKAILYDRPSEATVMNTIKKNNPDNLHPRIMLRGNKVEELKKLVLEDETAKRIYEDLKLQTDQYLTQNVYKYDTAQMQTIARGAVTRIMRLGFYYHMTGDKKYSERAIKELMAISDFPDWYPYHFLDASETAFAVSIGYDWLYHELTEKQREKIREAIVEKALIPILQDLNFDPDRQRSWFWTDPTGGAYPNNWIAVCCGSMSVAAMVIGDEEPQICAEVISKALKPVEDLLAQFGPDGGWYEGPTYWSYASKYLTHHILAMRDVLGTDYGISRGPGLANADYFIFDITGPTGFFNLTDSEYSKYSTPEQLAYAKIYDDENLYSLRMNALRNGNTNFVEDLINYDPNRGNGEVSAPLDSYYRGNYVSLMRTGWSDTDMFLGFHSGENGKNHSHLDSGTFVFDMFGHRWFKDTGKDQQTYSTDDRYQYYAYRAEGHNTLVINPDSGKDQNMHVDVPMERFETNADSALAICDLTKIYEYKGVKSAKRGVFMDKKNLSVIVRDEVKAKEPMEVYWFGHTEADIELSEDKRSAILAIENKKMYAEVMTEGYTFEVMKAEPLEYSPNPSNAMSMEGTQKLTIHGKNLSEFNVSVKIAPIFGEQTKPSFDSEEKALSEWKLLDENSELGLSKILVDGKELSDFESAKTSYAISSESYYKAPFIEAYGNGNVEVIQGGSNNMTARIDITNPNNSNDRKSYFVTFELKSSFTGEPENLTVLKPKSIFADTVPQPENKPENTMDGDYNTRWSSDSKKAYIEYDLGEEKQIDYVSLAFFVGDTRYTEFEVWLSSDAKEYKKYYQAKTSGTTLEPEGYKIDAKARYVRIVSNGNEDNAWFSPTEIKIYAKKEEELMGEWTASVKGNNLSLERTVSSTENTVYNYLYAVGIYENNSLAKIDAKTVSTTGLKTLSLNVDVENAASVDGKVFLWDSVNLAPVESVKTVSKLLVG